MNTCDNRSETKKVGRHREREVVERTKKRKKWSRGAFTIHNKLYHNNSNMLNVYANDDNFRNTGKHSIGKQRNGST